MPDVRALMWIDFESTGLLTDPDVPTLLEGAWTVTDPAGRQLTPLRQRYMCLPAAQTERDVDRHVRVAPAPGSTDGAALDGPVDWYSDRSGWKPETRYPIAAVREMHGANGLAEDYAEYVRARTADGPTTDVISDWGVLDSLLSFDLDLAGIGDDWESGTLALAGGGVSHYEDRFMRYCAPVTMGHKAMHYSTGADVSTVLRTLRIRSSQAVAGGHLPDLGKADQALALAREEPRYTALPTGWASIDLEPVISGWAASDRDVTEWIRAPKDPHRAAPGIARALMVYRLLPYLLDRAAAGYIDAAEAADLATVARTGTAQA